MKFEQFRNVAMANTDRVFEKTNKLGKANSKRILHVHSKPHFRQQGNLLKKQLQYPSSGHDLNMGSIISFIIDSMHVL